MKNLHLHDMLICDFDTKLQGITKIIRRNNNVVTLAYNNAYFRNPKNQLLKLNNYDVCDFEWLQVRNIIFMWTSSKFEWFDVTREVKYIIDLPGPFRSWSWHPSEGTLALLYETGKVQIVGFDFDDDLSKFVILAANQIAEETYTPSHTDLGCTIAWNKDGDSFAIAYTKEGRTVFEVYSEQCILLAKGDSEDVTLLPILTWHPDGCKIAVLQEQQCKYFIHMFENNGLKKDFLPLLHVDGQIKKVCLKWNDAGDVLAVQCVTEANSVLSLYSFRNYKWDLKQHLQFEKETDIISFNWITSPHSHIALQVITSMNELLYFFNWGVDGARWEDSGIMAIIDGNKLRLTDVGNELVPPPSSTIVNIYEAPVNFVTFSPNGQYKAVVLCDNTALIEDCSTKKNSQISLPELLNHNDTPLSFNNFVIDDDVNLYFVYNTHKNSFVYRLSKPVDNVLNWNEHVTIICELPSKITHISLCGEQLFIRTNIGGLFHDLKTKNVIETNQFVPVGEITAIHKNNINYVFSLSENSFYFNDNLIMNNVTSYLFLRDYIMITTSEDKLLCYELNLKDLQKLQNFMRNNIFDRPIPKGAILVNAIPNTTNIVLQNDRSDLEIVKPRILSVRMVKKLLNEKQFSQAFFMVKHDRLNINILVDLNPVLLLENMGEFVSSLGNCDNLNIFITGLENENSLDKLYERCIPADEKITTLPNKKITILQKIIETMSTLDRKYYLQSIITANLCLNTYIGMDSAIKEIKWGLAQQEAKQSISMDEIFHKIVPLTSAEDLLKAALSIQDFKLIQWIANKTQLDPLEYIPYFKDLAQMEPNYKSYKINNNLKRFDIAFDSLIKCDKVENELIQLLQKPDMCKLAVLRTLPDNQWYRLVIENCVKNLCDIEKYTEAGLLSKKIKNYTGALECFIEDGNIEEFMKVANIMKQKNVQSNMPHYYRGLLKKLRDTGKTKEAAQIYEILNEYEEGILLLINSKNWDEAMKYIIKYNRNDFIETNFYPAILEYSNELCGLFDQNRDQFEKQKQRLAALRLEKINLLMSKQGNSLQAPDNMPVDFEEPDAVRNADLCSLLSELSVSTQQTGFTNTSSSTSRRKKKLARKTRETREGSVFENIALMRQLHGIATEMFGYARLVHTTCLNLMELDKTALDASIKLHTSYVGITTTIEDSITEIWPEDFVNPPVSLNVTSGVLRLNIEHLEPKFRYPPEPLPSDWKVYTLS